MTLNCCRGVDRYNSLYFLFYIGLHPNGKHEWNKTIAPPFRVLAVAQVVISTNGIQPPLACLLPFARHRRHRVTMDAKTYSIHKQLSMTEPMNPRVSRLHGESKCNHDRLNYRGLRRRLNGRKKVLGAILSMFVLGSLVLLGLLVKAIQTPPIAFSTTSSQEPDGNLWSTGWKRASRRPDDSESDVSFWTDDSKCTRFPA